MINNIKPGDTIRFNEYLVGVRDWYDEDGNERDTSLAVVEEGDTGVVVKKLKDGRTMVKLEGGNFLFMTSAIMRQELVNTDNVV